MIRIKKKSTNEIYGSFLILNQIMKKKKAPCFDGGLVFVIHLFFYFFINLISLRSLL